MNYAALDFETAYWGPANACSLGITLSNGKEITDEWYHLIRPLFLNFDWRCIRVNQIHPEDVAGEEQFPAFWDAIAEKLRGKIVFAHNARFDMSVLASALRTYRLPEVPFRYGDTVALSRVLWQDLPNHKLDTVAGALGYDFNHHQALDDARACEFIVRKALEKTGAGSVEEMMDLTGCPLYTFHKFPRKRKKTASTRTR